METTITLWAALVGFATNIILLITQIVQVVNLKKQMNDVKVIVNNAEDLKQSLRKPLEGTWEVGGRYIKYHNIDDEFNCSGFVNFVWNDSKKEYDIYYVYSVRRRNNSADLVTAYCKGIAAANDDGSLLNNKLQMNMTVINRSASDNFVNNQKFIFVSSSTKKNHTKYIEFEFEFNSVETIGAVRFYR